jgi:hypothetical protein
MLALRMNYRLKYREPGVRPGTTRWALRSVGSTREAVEWMNANPKCAFLPAFVLTPGNQWKRPETVAILGPEPQ